MSRFKELNPMTECSGGMGMVTYLKGGRLGKALVRNSLGVIYVLH